MGSDYPKACIKGPSSPSLKVQIRKKKKLGAIIDNNDSLLLCVRYDSECFSYVNIYFLHSSYATATIITSILQRKLSLREIKQLLEVTQVVGVETGISTQGG